MPDNDELVDLLAVLYERLCQCERNTRALRALYAAVRNQIVSESLRALDIELDIRMLKGEDRA